MQLGERNRFNGGLAGIVAANEEEGQWLGVADCLQSIKCQHSSGARNDRIFPRPPFRDGTIHEPRPVAF
jgi:hypothetical protein